tara:strand:+ start:2713 stop:3054 length:342 start_codon:yes stop_codon:yes gene_type:complete
MTKLTTHALDIYTGKPAKGLKVDVYFIQNNKEKIKSIILNSEGRYEEPLTEKVKVGKYELVFYIGQYFKNKVELPNPNFLDEVSIKFGISDPNQKYHVPLLFSPWSYSTYRGS